MIVKGLLSILFVSILANQTAALSLTDAQWIRADNNILTTGPQVVRDFRRVHASPAGKAAISSQILIAGDSNYTLWVNGGLVGEGNDSLTSQQYCTVLNPVRNVFAVAVQNQATAPHSAAFIAAIQVNYDDGSFDVILTNDAWRGNKLAPGFQDFRFDDSTWPNAIVVSDSGTSLHVPSGPPNASSLSRDRAYWIWTDAIPPNSPGVHAPRGSHAFRKTITISGGSLVRSGTMIIDADNAYVLYINGNRIGSGVDYENGATRSAQRWTFTLDRPSEKVVIAVNASNTNGPAGLLVTVAFDAFECSCSTTVWGVSDGTWKFSSTVPAGFEKFDYNDDSWKHAVVEGPFGVEPWGRVPVKNGN